MARSDIALGLVITGLSAAFAVEASGLPTAPGTEFSAGFVPMILGCGGALAGLGIAAEGWRGAGADQQGEAGQPPTLAGLVRCLSVFLAAILYGLFAARTGFVPAAAAVIGGLALVFGASLRLAAGAAVAGSLILFLVFSHLLRVPLPPTPWLSALWPF